MDLKSLLPQNFIDLNGLKKTITKIREEIKTNSYTHPMTHPATMIVQDNNNQFVTKEQKEQWNNKLDADANAVSASKLQAPININGVPFDGTQDVTIPSTSNFIFKVEDGHLILYTTDGVTSNPTFTLEDGHLIMEIN